MPWLAARALAPGSGRTLNPITMALAAAARSTSASEIGPTPSATKRSRTKGSANLSRAARSASSDPWLSALTTRSRSRTPSPDCLLSSARLTRLASALPERNANRRSSARARAPRSDSPPQQAIPGSRDFRKPGHQGRQPGGYLLGALAPVIKEGPDPPRYRPDHKVVLNPQRALLDQHARHRALALLQVGVDHRGLARAVWIGPRFAQVADQQDHLQEVVDAGAGLG